MCDKITGVLEVGIDEAGQVIINHPDLMPDANGVGHIVFSRNQARNLARLLVKHADQSEADEMKKQEVARRKAAEAVPVDRSCRVLTDGSPVTDDHREIDPVTGQQKGYVVLCESERAKGFVRPVRRSYRHKRCGSITTMGLALAETYARDPGFYSGTFCVACNEHGPLAEFIWEGTTEQVGS